MWEVELDAKMDTLPYAALLVAAFLLSRFFLHHLGGCRRNHRLPPSPPSVPIIGHLHLLRPPRALSMAELANRYGPIIFLRLGARSALIISSPEVIEEVLSVNDIIFANHPLIQAGKMLGYDGTTMFWSPYGPHYRTLRRLTALKLFSTKRLNMLSAVRRDEVLCLVLRMLRGASKDGRGEVVLEGRVFELTYNMLSMMVAGKRYYGEEVDEEEAEKANNYKEISNEALKLLFSFNPRDFFPVLGWADLMGVEKRATSLSLRLDAFLTDLVEEHRRKRKSEATSMMTEGGGAAMAATEVNERKSTLIDDMLSMQKTDPETYTDNLIKGQIMMVLTGGSGSVAETTKSIMLMLLSHPEIMKKVRAEIDANVEPNRLLEEKDLPNFPYLHCVFKEVLRLVPPLLGMPPRASSKDCTIQGYHVPRGTMVFVNVWGLHRDPKLWEDPMAFRPERFVGHSGGRDGFRFTPFGMGRRGCPGENLGLRMVMYMVGIFVQCFDWDHMTAEEVDLSSLLRPTRVEKNLVVAKYKIRASVIDALS